MRRYEKIVLVLLAATFGWQLVPTAGYYSALFLATWLLICSYLVGGYWLFAWSPAPPAWLRVLIGCCLAGSLTSLLPAIELRGRLEPGYLAAPIANGILCLALGIYLVLQRRTPQIQHTYRLLFWRALIVLLSCSFFLYTPITFGPYRAVLLALNRGNQYLTANLLMHEYAQQRQQALAAQDYDAAIRYARQSLAAGKRWLGEDSLTDAYRISGATTNVYESYQIQADTAYAHTEFTKALRLYQAGDRYLLAADTRRSESAMPSSFWEAEKILSRENMGMCYLRMHQYTQSDSLFLEAIKAYKRLPNPSASWFPRLVSDLGESLAGEQQYQASSQVYRTANRLLASDTTQAARTMLLNNGLTVALNTINQDSTLLAFKRLRSLNYRPTDSVAYFKGQLYQAICTYKLARYADTEQILLRCLRAQQHRPRPDGNTLLFCRILLAKNALALAHYAQARAHLAAARAQLPAYQRTHGAGAGTSSCLSIEAALNKHDGQYALATQQYARLSATLPANNTGGEYSLPEALAELADLNVIMDDMPAAHSHAETLLAQLQNSQLPLTPSQTGLLAAVAYVNYAAGSYPAALVRYHRVLACNQQFGLAQSVASAAAWNGLGLLATAQHHYAQADTLYRRALALHKQVFGEQHPATGTVYLNYGQSRLQANDFDTAADYLNRSSRIAQAFFPPDHDVFADLDLALGDLAQHQRQQALAHSYYVRALPIYTARFGSQHWKTELALRKANQL